MFTLSVSYYCFRKTPPPYYRCRFQQPAELQLTGRRRRWRRQPRFWRQPLSVPQLSGLRQGRWQHELPVQINCLAPTDRRQSLSSTSRAKERVVQWFGCVNCLFLRLLVQYMLRSTLKDVLDLCQWSIQ